MPDLASGVRSLAFSEPVLTSEAVEQIDTVLRAERDPRPVLIDCQALTSVTAPGLAALLELGRSASGLRELALTQLTRPVLLAAIQAGLAERYAIYATNQACLIDLSPAETAPCER
ncbi:MAG: hypothetical protein JWN48_5362 [Myxococcaceae bacterium]|nr:hypothetical protein [Myxococcaceae bacterium]